MRLGLAALLSALVVCPAAAAHGGGGTDYRSKVTAIRPAQAGLTVIVRDADDRLRLTAERSTTIYGYEGEPYLRFVPDGVYRNARSPATYLNEARYGGVPVPAEADPKAPPSWRKVASGRSYEWHDHRIHWMSTVPPRSVRDAPDERQRLFDWRVPIAVDGRLAAILGTLEYVPSESRFRWILLAPLTALVLAAAAFWWVRRRGSERA